MAESSRENEELTQFLRTDNGHILLHRGGQWGNFEVVAVGYTQKSNGYKKLVRIQGVDGVYEVEVEITFPHGTKKQFGSLRG